MKKNRKIALVLIIAAAGLGLVSFLLLIGNRPISNEHLESYFAAKEAYLIGDLKTSIQILENLARESPKLYQGRLLLGKSYYLSDQYEAAAQVFRKLIKEYPVYLEAGLWMARVEIQMQKTDQAALRIENLLSWNSDDPRLLGMMGNIEELNGNTAVAINYYRRAGLYEEELARNRLSLGKLYSRLGIYEKAKNELIQARELLEIDNPLFKALEGLIEEMNVLLEENP